MVPLIDGLIGASIPPLTWFGAIASLFGVGFLESSGSPCVRSQAYFLFFSFFCLCFLFLVCVSRCLSGLAFSKCLIQKKSFIRDLNCQVPYSLYYTSTNMLSLMSVQFACMCKNHLKLQRQVLLMIAM